MKRSRCPRVLVPALIASAVALGLPAARAQDAASLQAASARLRPALAASPFGRPLVLESAQDSADLRGDVYAIVERPFATVSGALQGVDQWCALLMLHLNVKNCRTDGGAPNQELHLSVGRKVEQTVGDAYPIAFTYRVPAARADYLRVQMAAASGPLGTRDYRLAFEAAPLDATRSFVHLSYAYSYGATARLAMLAYLATTGRAKVGFSVAGQDARGKPVLVDGLRGVIERNTMRYYLAIETHVNAMALPPAQRAEQSLVAWFDATERYPTQLHDLERGDYLAMKRHELQRQGAMP